MTTTAILAFLTETIAQAPSAAGKTFTAETALFDQNIIDSFEIINLIGAIETRYGIALDADDLTVQNFNTLTSIAALIGRYLAK
jgi:acyl carrier protein